MTTRDPQWLSGPPEKSHYQRQPTHKALNEAIAQATGGQA